jgi:hypothetical protein
MTGTSHAEEAGRLATLAAGVSCAAAGPEARRRAALTVTGFGFAIAIAGLIGPARDAPRQPGRIRPVW